MFSSIFNFPGADSDPSQAQKDSEESSESGDDSGAKSEHENEFRSEEEIAAEREMERGHRSFHRRKKSNWQVLSASMAIKNITSYLKNCFITASKYKYA